MFEKVSRSLEYDSNIFLSTDIYMDTTVDHFTPLALHVRGNSNDNNTCIHNVLYHVYV